MPSSVGTDDPVLMRLLNGLNVCGTNMRMNLDRSGLQVQLVADGPMGVAGALVTVSPSRAQQLIDDGIATYAPLAYIDNGAVSLLSDDAIHGTPAGTEVFISPVKAHALVDAGLAEEI
jgi:hypothetical protein